MPTRTRNTTLTLHIVVSVGWLGAVVAYLPFAILALSTSDLAALPGIYRSMDLIGWLVIVPLAIAALVTGVLQSMVTQWGLLRYYWVITKLLLTVVSVTVLLMHMPVVSRTAKLTSVNVMASSVISERTQFVLHAGGGLLILLLITAVSVFKPWGLTAFGKRNVNTSPVGPRFNNTPNDQTFLKKTTLWKVLGLLAVVALLIAIVLHLLQGGLPHH